MLVIFTSPASYDITMFGDVAKDLIRMMGHSGSIPGAIASEDIPQALENLRTGIKTADAEAPEPAGNSDDGEEEDAVSMSHRAYPLIEMLESAVNNNSGIRWYKK